MLSLVHNPVVEGLSTLGSIVGAKSFINNERLVTTQGVEVESRRSTVVVVKSVGQDLGGVSQFIIT